MCKTNINFCAGFEEIEDGIGGGGDDGYRYISDDDNGVQNVMDDKSFSMAMDCLTSIFGMRSRAYHDALYDIMGEAVVITAYVRFISQFDDLYEDEKS